MFLFQSYFVFSATLGLIVKISVHGWQTWLKKGLLHHLNADLRHGNVFDMIILNAHRVYDLNTVTKFPPNKEKTAHNRDRKYWKTRWWAKRQTWAIAAWPAVCWVKHSALLECVCECVWVFQRREGGSWAHRGIVGSSVTGFLPLPGYKQCSASVSLSRCSSPYSLISSRHIFLSCYILHPCLLCIMCVAALLMMADRIAVRTLIMWWPPAWRPWDHASVFI